MHVEQSDVEIDAQTAVGIELACMFLSQIITNITNSINA